MLRVVWLQSALNELADAWMRADAEQRRAINSATRAIDQQLSDAPERLGESRADGQRIWFQAPLGITFEIMPGQPLVRIVHVWSYRPGR